MEWLWCTIAVYMIIAMAGHDKTSRREFPFINLRLSIVSCLALAYKTHRYGACDDTPFA